MKKGLSSKPLSISEQNCLVELIQEFGTSWTKICEFLPGRSENQVKNFMNATVRRNIRRYNKFKPENEKIKGNSLKLLECPEIKKILLCGKEVKRKEFVGFKLSKDALDFAEAVAQEDRDQSGELSLISELDNILMLLLENIKG